MSDTQSPVIIRGSVSFPGWDVTIVQLGPEVWWWNAWHEEASIELTGREPDKLGSIEAATSAIRITQTRKRIA